MSTSERQSLWESNRDPSLFQISAESNQVNRGNNFLFFRGSSQKIGFNSSWANSLWHMLPMLPRHQRHIEIGVLRSRTPVESIPKGEVSIIKSCGYVCSAHLSTSYWFTLAWSLQILWGFRGKWTTQVHEGRFGLLCPKFCEVRFLQRAKWYPSEGKWVKLPLIKVLSLMLKRIKDYPFQKHPAFSIHGTWKTWNNCLSNAHVLKIWKYDAVVLNLWTYPQKK